MLINGDNGNSANDNISNWISKKLKREVEEENLGESFKFWAVLK